MGILSGIKGKIKNALDGTRKKLDDTVIEHDYEGIIVEVTGAKNIKSISFDPNLLEDVDSVEYERRLVHGINLALQKAEAIAVDELKTAGEDIIPGFARIFGGR